ncbi:hypothetical protein psyc5s11_33580 [Clostridium gelidum]|uniref:DUF11 domain-containing protein n=1 Tax=Clostridium gelidum TaxID=704125 RepID=A0ABN6J043_9CLOT|nr:DUF11 domain-containing protein [Clostridium gelidum]BCZ47291.1 hypothetical protein psyc5s11_33580 [Clostridium gelidum]
MANSRCYLKLSLIKNHVTVKPSNTHSYQSICSMISIEVPCLVLTQSVSKCGNNLVYSVYIINNLNCDITNIHLKDILPKGVKFISTYVENGKYKHYHCKIFYNIANIKSHSFCKIIIVLCPQTPDIKVNSIEVVSKNFNCIINNPFRSYILALNS